MTHTMAQVRRILKSEVRHSRDLLNNCSSPSGLILLPLGVRDYIHVVDLALGHVAALNRLKEKCGCVVYNLGTGKGASVLDMINAFSKASGKEIKYEVAPRRGGDIAACYAGELTGGEKKGYSKNGQHFELI